MLVKSYKDRQSFARWVCDAWIYTGLWAGLNTWKPLAEQIIEAGHGVVLEV